MSEQAAMQAIKMKWGGKIKSALLAHDAPAPVVSEAFLAALIKGESGGINDAKRFEKTVLSALWEVLVGRKAAYGSIGRADLVAYVSCVQDAAAPAPGGWSADTLARIDSLATSWGLTQIMGYHCIELAGEMTADIPGSSPAHMDIVSKPLTDPDFALGMTLRMLAGFVKQWSLENITTDAERSASLFRCWNTGRPDGVTFDSNYASNGLERMSLYENLS